MHNRRSTAHRWGLGLVTVVLCLGTPTLAAPGGNGKGGGKPGGDPPPSPSNPMIVARKAGMIVVAEADGSNPVEVVAGKDPSWAPSRDQFAFNTTDGDGLYLQSIDVTNGSPIGPPTTLIAFDPPQFAWFDPTFTPDGTKVVFHSDNLLGENQSGNDLYQINVDGTGLSNITNTDDDENFLPAYSSDGSLLAYGTWFNNSQGGQYDVIVIDLLLNPGDPGYETSVINDGASSALFPVGGFLNSVYWGKQTDFLLVEYEKELYCIDPADPVNAVQLTFSGDNQHVTSTLDDSQIIFARIHPDQSVRVGGDIMRADLDYTGSVNRCPTGLVPGSEVVIIPREQQNKRHFNPYSVPEFAR